MSGSNNRIAKRFVIAKKSIIIGADSFWEGIDFHDCGIDTVFAAKIPFESPDQPEVRLRQKKLEDNVKKWIELAGKLLVLIKT